MVDWRDCDQLLPQHKVSIGKRNPGELLRWLMAYGKVVERLSRVREKGRRALLQDLVSLVDASNAAWSPSPLGRGSKHGLVGISACWLRAAGWAATGGRGCGYPLPKRRKNLVGMYLVRETEPS